MSHFPEGTLLFPGESPDDHRLHVVRPAPQPEGPTHWEMTVVIDFKMVAYDICERCPGDAEIDFANRGVQRVRAALQKFVDEIDGGYVIRAVDGKLARRTYG